MCTEAYRAPRIVLQRARSWAHSRDVDESPRSTKSGYQLEAREVSFAESPGVTLPCSQEPPTSPGPLILDVSPGGGLARRLLCFVALALRPWALSGLCSLHLQKEGDKGVILQGFVQVEQVNV